ncbi:hypothetical protein [Azospirillum picis]|uniref:Uncharacterized protein n=1 Tax=Azospirillum picis TaxID=488438 RepID=A0ABU0MRT1_9PROT|nr:hypothetical protein [Azospirillum picis]MBP2302560.1 hypothetical protein [Azospirillum picis]MDQ0536198.1 hypothetical protein [Azospirillum picis]
MIGAPATQAARPVINYKTTAARLCISAASDTITLDGMPIGTLKREPDESRMVWAAHLTDVLGHRAGYHKSALLPEVIKMVTNKVTDVLRRHNPDADWGVLHLEATPGELREIAESGCRVLRYPHALRYSRRACPEGRRVLIRNPHARGPGHPHFEGTLVQVRKVPRAEAIAADPRLEYRHADAKHFAEVIFILAAAAPDSQPCEVR